MVPDVSALSPCQSAAVVVAIVGFVSYLIGYFTGRRSK